LNGIAPGGFGRFNGNILKKTGSFCNPDYDHHSHQEKNNVPVYDLKDFLLSDYMDYYKNRCSEEGDYGFVDDFRRDQNIGENEQAYGDYGYGIHLLCS